MASRVLLVLLIALLVGVPAAQHASAVRDGAHAAAVKHPPRIPPSGARTTTVFALLVIAPPAALAPPPAAAAPDRLPDPVPAAPFVPPRV